MVLKTPYVEYVENLAYVKEISTLRRLQVQTNEDGCRHIATMDNLEELVLIYNGGCSPMWYLPSELTLLLARMKRLHRVCIFEARVDEIKMKEVNPGLCIENHWCTFDTSEAEYEEYKDKRYQTYF